MTLHFRIMNSNEASSPTTDPEEAPVVPDEMTDEDPTQQIPAEESDSDSGYTYELSPIIGIDELLKVRAEDKYYYEEDLRPIFQQKPKVEQEPQPKKVYIFISSSSSEDEQPRKKTSTKGMSIEEDAQQEFPLTEEGKRLKKLAEDKPPLKAPHRPETVLNTKQASEEIKQKLTAAMKEITERIQQK